MTTLHPAAPSPDVLTHLLEELSARFSAAPQRTPAHHPEAVGPETVWPEAAEVRGLVHAVTDHAARQGVTLTLGVITGERNVDLDDLDDHLRLTPGTRYQATARHPGLNDAVTAEAPLPSLALVRAYAALTTPERP